MVKNVGTDRPIRRQFPARQLTLQIHPIMLNAMQHHLTAEDLASVRGDLISRGGEPASERDGDWLADLGRDPDWVWEPTDEEIEEMARRAAEAERGQRTLECFVCDGLGC